MTWRFFKNRDFIVPAPGLPRNRAATVSKSSSLIRLLREIASFVQGRAALAHPAHPAHPQPGCILLSSRRKSM
jgi:hypothetical protein